MGREKVRSGIDRRESKREEGDVHVGLGTGDGEEGTEVSYTESSSVSHDEETGEADGC